MNADLPRSDTGHRALIDHLKAFIRADNPDSDVVAAGALLALLLKKVKFDGAA